LMRLSLRKAFIFYQKPPRASAKNFPGKGGQRKKTEN